MSNLSITPYISPKYNISNINTVIVGNNININGFKMVVISFVALYFNKPLIYSVYITNGKKTMI